MSGQPPDDLGRRVLEGGGEFDVVLLDAERWRCKLVEWGTDELLVQTSRARYLLPKHSIKYIIIQEEGGEHVIALAAAEVWALREFLDQGPELGRTEHPEER